MAVAVLYDVHGNLPALEAVLREIDREPVDSLLIGGDVFPGPMARECLGVLEAVKAPVRYLRGNGDRLVVAQRRGEPIDEVPEGHRAPFAWHASELDDEQATWLASWPRAVRSSVAGVGEVLFCHATPSSDTDLVTRRTPAERFARRFGGHRADLIVCGHTHMQFDRSAGRGRVVNAGSVGMPFGEPGAHWLRLGPEVELRRTEYDLEEAAARIRATEYPGADLFADRNVLHPPSEAEMLELFEAAR